MSKNQYRIDYRDKAGTVTAVDYVTAFDVSDVIHDASKFAAQFHETYVITEAEVRDDGVLRSLDCRRPQSSNLRTNRAKISASSLDS